MKKHSRWFVRILWAAAGPLVLPALTMQIILWTGVPRHLVLDKLQRRTGLRIEAASLTTGWIGHTTLRDVRCFLPLAGEPFLEIPNLRVDHSNLISALAGDLTIESLSLDHPTIRIVQDSSQRWNVQDIAQILGASAAPAGGDSAASSDSAREANMPPSLTITGGTLELVDHQKRSMTLAPLAFSGSPRGLVVWQCHLAISGQLSADAEIAPDARWTHVVHLTLDHIGPWLRPWIGKWPQDDHLAGTWNGRFVDETLAGTLTIDNLTAGLVHAVGSVRLGSETAGSVLSADDLTIDIPKRPVPVVRMLGGSLLWTGTTAIARQIWLAGAGGSVRIDGSFATAAQVADLSTAWYGLEYPPGVTQSGSLSLNIEQPWPHHRHVKAGLSTKGSTSSTNWQVDLQADGAGSDWNQMDWSLGVSTLALRAGRSFALHDVNAKLTMRGDEVDLASVQAPGLPEPAALNLHGGADLRRKLAWVWADATRFPVGTDRDPIDFDFNAWASAQEICLSQLDLRQGDLALDGRGDYVYSRPSPADFFVNATLVPNRDTPTEVGPSTKPYGTPQSPWPLTARSLVGSAELTGTVRPLHLDIHGHLVGENMMIEKRAVGDLAVDIQGLLDADAANVHSNTLDMLGGHCQLAGWWPTDNHAFRVDLTAHDMQVDQVAARNDLRGTADAHVSIDITSGTLNGVRGAATATVHQFAIVNRFPFAVSEVDLPRITLNNGIVRADDIRLLQGETASTTHPVNGSAVWDAAASINLRTPSQIELSAEQAGGTWVISLPGRNAEVLLHTFSAQLAIDIARQSANGRIDLSAGVDSLGAATGSGIRAAPPTSSALPRVELVLASKIGGRSIEITRLHADVLNGRLDGTASVDIDHPEQARASVRWSDFQSGAIAVLLPAIRPINGSFDGSIDVAPAAVDPDAPPPLGPSRVVIDVRPAAASIGPAKVGSLHLVGYFGPDRFVLNSDQKSPNTLSIGGGEVQFWGRLTRHQGAQMQCLVVASFSHIQLQQLQRAGSPNASPEIGELSGHFTWIADPRHLTSANVQGDIRIDRSALVNVPVIAILYAAFHPSQRLHAATGAGSARFLLEGDQLHLITARYENEGFEVRAAGTIDHIFSVPQSPLDIVAVGSGQPLENTKLPLIQDIDSILAAIQHDLLAEHVGGSIGSPTERRIPLSDLGQEMREFLTGDVTGQTQNTAD
jgi:hypothetical protein